MVKTINLGKVDYYGRGRKINAAELELELNQTENGYVFAVSGCIWNGAHTDTIIGGQCLEDMKHYCGQIPKFWQVYNLWKKYHLNDCHAGTERQDAIIEAYRKEHETDEDTIYLWSYEKSCKVLEDAGCLYDDQYLYNGKPYQYGTAWLYREIPFADLCRIKFLIGYKEDDK